MRRIGRTRQPSVLTQRLRTTTGGFTLLWIEKSTPTTITALLEENDARRLARLELEVTDGAKPIVVSSTLRSVPRTSDIPLARLTEAQTISALTAKMDAEFKADCFSGAVLIGHRGRIVFEKAVGFANRESRTPNTLDTQFRNGSMSKMFTATAVMQLVEAGKLSLDDSVGKVMPDYPNADVARKVIIRHLLGHTGGTGDFFGPQFVKNRLTLKTHADYVALFGSRASLHEPGAEFRYSNYGMVLRGAIIERVSGMSYFDYVRTHVFEPAGMKSTGSLPESDTVPNRATGYMRSTDAWVPNTDTLPWSGTAAGGGYSTVGGFFRFADALQSGRLVSKASLTQMITPAINPRYGFGMFLTGDGATRSFGHGGGAPGQNGDPKNSNTFVPFNVPTPPQGKFAAVSDGMGPGMQLMYRDIKLDGSAMLEVTVFYVNGIDGLSGYSGPFVAPGTLAIDAGPNQRFRVDILAPAAAADSMAVADVRATVFETSPDAPARRGPTPIRYDLSPWAGQTVRLRIATAANQAPLRAGIDNVRLIPIER